MAERREIAPLIERLAHQAAEAVFRAIRQALNEPLNRIVEEECLATIEGAMAEFERSGQLEAAPR